MDETTQTSRATSNTSNSNFNSPVPYWIEASISEEYEIGMRKYSEKSNANIISDEVKVSSSEVEKIKIHKCRRKSGVDIINKLMKGSSSD